MTTASYTNDLDTEKLDFYALENGTPKEPNSKRIIVEHLRKYGVPDPVDPLPVANKNGTVIRDDFQTYLNNANFSTGPFVKLSNGCPLDFQYDAFDKDKIELEKYKDKSSLDLGTFVHEAILDASKWGKIVVEPPFSRASHDGCNGLVRFWEDMVPAHAGILAPDLSTAKVDTKKEYIDQMKAASGMACVGNKDYTIVKKVHDRWMAYEGGMWAKILDGAMREVSVYADDFMGLPMRVRPDALLLSSQIGVNAIVSVKTTHMPSVDLYKRQYWNMNYSCKESAYRKIVSHVTGLEFNTTIQIVLSTAEPFAMGVFILSDKEMELSFQRFNKAVEMAKMCIEANYFPGWNVYSDVDCYGIIDMNIE